MGNGNGNGNGGERRRHKVGRRKSDQFARDALVRLVRLEETIRSLRVELLASLAPDELATMSLVDENEPRPSAALVPLRPPRDVE